MQKLFEGYGYKPYFVEGHEPMKMHQLMAQALDTVMREIQKIWKEARAQGFQGRPAWPMIILRSPKGWTCPAEIDGKKCEATGVPIKCRWETWKSPGMLRSSKNG